MAARSDALRAQWLAGVGHASSHTWELIFPAIAVPLAREQGRPYEEVLPLAFGLYLLFGLGAPVAGWAADRFGGRAVLLACLLGGGVSGLGVAMADGDTAIFAALAGLGFAASLYHPAGLALLSIHFERGLGRAFAVNGMAGNIGIAATPVVAGLLASLFGWRTAYLLLCLPALGIGAGFLFLPFADARREGPRSAGDATLAPGQGLALVAFAGAVTAGGLAYRLHTLVVPALLTERLPWLATLSARFPDLAHLDNLGATFLTSAAYSMGLLGQWLGGRVADTRPLAPAYLAFHVAALVLVVAVVFLSGLPLLVVLFAYLFFAIGMQPVENSLVARLTPAAWRGRAYAGKFVLAFGIGAMGTYVVGWLAPFGGLTASIAAVAALELVLIGCVLVLWRAMSPAPRLSEAHS